jgi:uncharacterized SAM-binding protein YcdF (DUF218 family)
MFFILSKTLGLLVKPLTWLFVSLLMSVFCKKPKLTKTSGWFSLFILLFFTNPLLIDIVIKKWEPPPVAVETLPACEIGIVMGGFSCYLPKSDHIELTPSGDRIWQAVSLYKQGKMKYILTTGGNFVGAKPEAAAVYDALIATGVPDSVLLAETKSLNTYENAVFSVELIAATHSANPTCILITSAVHIKRSLGCFRKAGLNPYVFPANHIGRYDKVYWAEWLNPDPGAFQYWDHLINEWVGLAVYRMKGYI